MSTGQAVLDNFYLYNPDDLERMKEKIIDRCAKHNARAYINLNKRSYYKASLNMLAKVTNQILAQDYKGVNRAYDSVVGNMASQGEKMWIVDVDTIDGVNALATATLITPERATEILTNAIQDIERV